MQKIFETYSQKRNQTSMVFLLCKYVDLLPLVQKIKIKVSIHLFSSYLLRYGHTEGLRINVSKIGTN